MSVLAAGRPVSEDVWSDRNTGPDAIADALRRLVRERHAANRGLAPARVLNLVVVVDRSSKDEIADRLERIGRYSPSRTILCSVEHGRRTLDASAAMSYLDPVDGGLHIVHEKVEIDIGPAHLPHLDAIIDPVLISELPTALWSPSGHGVAVQALLATIDVLLLDSDEPLEPSRALARAFALGRSVYVVDLAWLRATRWRERLAASFDPPDRLVELHSLKGISIRHRPSASASALLLAGWLASRLQWQPRRLAATAGSGWRGTVGTIGREAKVEIALEPSDEGAPGLDGVALSGRDGFSLSLDRARGGLEVRERSAAGEERVSQALGASPGDEGVLGEGIRQAMLRDPAYRPSVAAALKLAAA